MAMELGKIKKLLKQGKLIIGTNNTLKKLRANKLEKIWLSSNVPERVKEDLLNYSKLNNVKVIDLDIANDELGVVCKKPFSVSVASLIKGEN